MTDFYLSVLLKELEDGVNCSSWMRAEGMSEDEKAA